MLRRFVVFGVCAASSLITVRSANAVPAPAPPGGPFVEVAGDPYFGLLSVGKDITLGQAEGLFFAFTCPSSESGYCEGPGGVSGISRVAITGDSAEQFQFVQDNCTGYVSGRVNVGTTSPPCEVKVKYAPKVSGYHSANLVFYVFGSTTSTWSIPLTGDAVALELRVTVDGALMPNSGGEVEAIPSTTSCKTGALLSAARHQVQITCFDVVNFEQVSGCEFFVQASLGEDDGGHAHGGGERPLVLASERGRFPLDSWLSVDSEGSLRYAPPEISGDVRIFIGGTDPFENNLNGTYFDFKVRRAGFVPVDQDGIKIVVDSHPGDGDFGTPELNVALGKMVQLYRLTASRYHVKNPVTVRSEGVSLRTGGLFDYNWTKFPWEHPHCGHRVGTEIDFSMSIFTDTDGPRERKALANAIRFSGMEFPIKSESPESYIDHWHAKLKAQ